MTDDQREGMQMLPRTRRIFRKGVTFTEAFATTPLCCPSRASVLTGRYAHNHGVLANTWEGGTEHYDPRLGLPFLLQRGGYTTGIVGKYLNGVPLEQAPSYFDRYVRTEGRSYYGGRWNVNGIVQQLPGYSTSVMADAASLFVLEQAITGKPWFLMVTTVAPHRPATPESRYSRLRVGKWKGNPAIHRGARRHKPAYVRSNSYSWSEGRQIRKAQFRTLASVDDLVFEIFETLRVTSQERNTLAFFLSDNGMMWGEFGLLNKGYPYTPSVKIPLMMRWPERLPSRHVDDRLVANIDIAPTVLDAAGLPQDPGRPMDGRSLLDQSWEREWLLLEYWRNITTAWPWASLRSKRWQYIENYGRGIFRELYDLQSDPWQLTNLLRRGVPYGAPDPGALAERLLRFRSCRGTTGAHACP